MESVMPLYRKFTTFVAILIVIAMLALCVAQYFTYGKFQVSESTGEKIYFFQTGAFLTALLLAIVFAVSVVGVFILPSLPQVSTIVSIVAFGIAFYEMAVGDMNFIVAAVVLLLAGLHIAGNAIFWFESVSAKDGAAEEDVFDFEETEETAAQKDAEEDDASASAEDEGASQDKPLASGTK